jgi:hypothetical protein
MKCAVKETGGILVAVFGLADCIALYFGESLMFRGSLSSRSSSSKNYLISESAGSGGLWECR